jgi:hypothetical protein
MQKRLSDGSSEALHKTFLSFMNCISLNLPTTTIVAQPINVVKWQLTFNSLAPEFGI